MKELFLFYHIPKTGGTSLRWHLARYLGEDEGLIHLSRQGEEDSRRRGLAPFAERPEATRSPARVLAGHWLKRSDAELVGHDRLLELTVLREPAALTVSRYNMAMFVREHRGEAVVPFEVWDGEKGRDFQFRFLAKHLGLSEGRKRKERMAAVTEALERFWLVICLEHLDAYVPPICRRIGVPLEGYTRLLETGTTIPRRLELTDELSDRLRKANPIDLELYERFRAKHAMQLAMGEGEAEAERKGGASPTP